MSLSHLIIFDSKCRCCFMETNDTAFSLIDECIEFKTTIYTIFQSCSGLSLSQDEIIKGRVCQSCVDKLLNWRRFRQQLIETSDLFKKSVPDVDSPCDDDSCEDMTCLEYVEDILEEGIPANSVTDRESPVYSQSHKGNNDKNHTEMFFICNLCDSTRFSLITDLRRHMTNVHANNKTPSKEFPCPICGKIFKFRDKMTRHREMVHFKDQVCHVMCDICGLSCINNDVLRRHLVTHSDERPFKCSFCNKSFKLNGVLTAHIKATHIGDRSYVCIDCGSTFKAKRQLEDHKATHSEERPFKCQHCPKTFKLKTLAKRHEMTIHSRNETEWKTKRKNRFQCALCPVTFYMKKQVMKHIQEVHEECGDGDLEDFVRRTIFINETDAPSP